MAEAIIDTNHFGALVEAARKSHSEALVVWQDGKPLLEWYGDGKARKIEAMSVTKSVVSLAMGRLLTQTKITSLNQTVADFYPEWKQGHKAKITIRHLMNHTSGLQNFPITYQEIYPSPDFVQLALCAELENPPGTTFSYNNKALCLLAGVVKKACGKKLDDCGVCGGAGGCTAQLNLWSDNRMCVQSRRMELRWQVAVNSTSFRFTIVSSAPSLMATCSFVSFPLPSSTGICLIDSFDGEAAIVSGPCSCTTKKDFNALGSGATY
jgi:hypothetical protein